MTTMVGAATGSWARLGIGAPAAGVERVSVARNLLLFFGAPFIGLAYIVLLPFAGVVALAKAALLGR